MQRFQLFRKHSDYYKSWQKAIANGLMTCRPFSRHTYKQYCYYVALFRERYDQVSFENLKAELAPIPADQFARRKSVHSAIISFGKFLAQEDALHSFFPDKAKTVKPKPYKPPRRLSAKEGDVQSCHRLQHPLSSAELFGIHRSYTFVSYVDSKTDKAKAFVAVNAPDSSEWQ